MKRRKPRQPRPRPNRVQPSGVPPTRHRMSRREVLSLAKFYVPATAVLGAGGWYLVANVRADISEADLSRVGNGIPAVVQIHDPQCPSCQVLQRETRAALEAFDHTQIQFLVATITRPEAHRFAAQFNARPVTLLLFDGDGRMREALQGVNSREVLARAFRRHLTRSAQTG